MTIFYASQLKIHAVSIRTSVAKYLCQLACAFLFLFTFMTIPVTVHAADNPLVGKAMSMLKSETEKLGSPKLENDSIFFGTTDMENYFHVVDMVKAKYGANATIFAKKGTNYIRISTNIMKDGQRAVGSVLDPAGSAYANIAQGKSFYGVTDILGKKYDTAYEPIKSEAGEMIGILYVGFLME